MNIPLENGDKVVSAVFHEGSIIVFTEYGKVFMLKNSGNYFSIIEL